MNIETDNHLLTFLSSEIDMVLKPLIPAGVPCALIEFPNYSNPGDSAIWLGEKKWLQQNNNAIIYTCELDSYSKEVLEATAREGYILLQGGGNFGDLWLAHQSFRERVIQDFPHRKIIQLPQSIFFEEEKNIIKAQAVLNAHPDFTLLCRDTQSFDFAKVHFTCASYLCPDIAFTLERLERTNVPEYEVVWLARNDKESLDKIKPVDSRGILTTDWLFETRTGLHLQAANLAKAVTKQQNKQSQLSILVDTYHQLAMERLRRGCDILSKGKLIVTDRLHAHILCLLMNIPHIVMDNNYGKLKNFYKTWTYRSPFAIWADSPEEVIGKIRSQKSFANVLESFSIHDSVLTQLSHSLQNAIGAAKEERECWNKAIKTTAEELKRFVTEGESIILIDDDKLRANLHLEGISILPFLENNHQFWGLPKDDETAMAELERLRVPAARFLAIAWPAFWWLHYYTAFAKHLHTAFPCLLANERLLLFNLASKPVAIC